MAGRGDSSAGRSRKFLFAAHLEMAEGLCQRVEAGLDRAGIFLAETHDVDAGQVWFREYFRTRAEAESRLNLLRPLVAGWLGRRTFTARVSRIAEVDWSESWKKTFHTARVSRRIVIKPSWEKFRAGAGDCVLELDPGMSFGTGLHPTTRACLRYIDRLAGGGLAGGSFLDAGCGSGVLAIAAAKLGFRRVVAVDFDPVAVRAARENCRRNGVEGIVRCRKADLGSCTFSRPFDVVAANMFSSEHERFGRTISGAVSGVPPGFLLVAGTMKNQYRQVCRMYGERGLVEERSVTCGEWCSGLLRRG